MSAICGMAFVSMLGSFFITETTEGLAAAINQAGSLRMQSYRIAASLAPSAEGDTAQATRITGDLVAEYEERLKSPRITRVIPYGAADPIREAYDRIVLRWQSEIFPLLDDYLRSSTTDVPRAQSLRQAYRRTVDAYVKDIDHLVNILELDLESRIEFLRVMQTVALFITVAVVFVTMYLTNSRVLLPLRDLMRSAEAARRGDFAVRTRFHSDDELGHLAHTFNIMADDLSRLYGDLEERVRTKTRDLERTNRTLQLLYNTARRLSEAPPDASSFEELLHELEKVLGLGGGAICLAESGRSEANKIASTQRPTGGQPYLCARPRCNLCFNGTAPHIVEVKDGGEETGRILVVPIQDQNHRYGVLLMEIPAGRSVEPWQVQLLEAVADHIDIAIQVAQRGMESRRIALFEERSVIARELHDSLAQSLSYLKIQVSRLDLALKRPDGAAHAADIVQELREGVSSAYRQLRELLTTFRLKMDGRELGAALEETIDEFATRHPEVSFRLENRLPSGRLSANEEIHVLQIIREALSNVVRHAHARNAAVCLCSDDAGSIFVTIEDDGRGIPNEAERRGHYGIAIMQDRAQGLNGTLKYGVRAHGGTRVELCFTPQPSIKPVSKQGMLL
ncbi:MAG: type IV pili methyl-accepting chemotaxis transducer N-terminal domain-containing protein [Thiohalomonadaceae bacterium]